MGPPADCYDQAWLNRARPGRPVYYRAGRVIIKTGWLGNKSVSLAGYVTGRTGCPTGSVDQAWSVSARPFFKTESLSGIFQNHFWVLWNTYVLAYIQNYKARTHPMLP